MALRLAVIDNSAKHIRQIFKHVKKSPTDHQTKTTFTRKEKFLQEQNWSKIWSKKWNTNCYF